jgi:hypothetical protein
MSRDAFQPAPETRLAHSRRKPRVPADLQEKSATIERAGIAELRDIWRAELGGSPPPIRAYGVLKCILAWRVQKKYLGGLSGAAQQRLDRHVAELDRNPKGDPPILRLKPGMVLVRSWQGVKHQVLVLA